MATQAQIDARKAALGAARTAFNNAAQTWNAMASALNSALSALRSDGGVSPDSLVAAFNAIVSEAVAAIPALQNLIAAADAMVPIGPPPPPPPPPNYSGNRVQIGLGKGSEIPSWAYADSVLRLAWQRPGGDWSDRNGDRWTSDPGLAYATASCDVFARVPMDFDITSMIDKLVAENTGIMLMGSGISIGSSRAQDASLRPTLTVKTSSGQFACPLLYDGFLIPPEQGQGGNCTFEYLASPAVLKFDLSSVAGTVQSATLHTASYGVYNVPSVWAAYYLETPVFVTDPANEIGGVQQGIAATMATDADLKSHPSVVAYTQFSSHDEIYLSSATNAPNGVPQWSLISSGEAVRNPDGTPVIGPDGKPVFQTCGGGVDANGFAREWTHNPAYVEWPEFGVTVGRVTVEGFGDLSIGFAPSGMHMRRWVAPIHSPALSYERDIGAGWNELYLRYLIKVDADVFPDPAAPPNTTGMRFMSGVKMPGLTGAYDDTWYRVGQAFGLPGPTDSAMWSYRIEPTGYSTVNPNLMRPGIYAYDATAVQDGSGDPWDFNYNVCYRAGHHYCIEQYVKLNTFTNGAPNSDGEIRQWLDGVLIYERTGRMVRKDARVQFYEIPIGVFYHGGVDGPVGDIHFEFGGVCVATEYIGPPKKVAT